MEKEREEERRMEKRKEDRKGAKINEGRGREWEEKSRKSNGCAVAVPVPFFKVGRL